MSSSSSSQQRDPDPVEQDRMLEDKAPSPSQQHATDSSTPLNAITLTRLRTHTTVSFLEAMGASDILIQRGEMMGEPCDGDELDWHVKMIVMDMLEAPHSLSELFKPEALLLHEDCTDEETIFYLIQNVPCTQLNGNVSGDPHTWVSFRSHFAQTNTTKEFQKYFAEEFKVQL